MEQQTPERYEVDPPQVGASAVPIVARPVAAVVFEPVSPARPPALDLGALRWRDAALDLLLVLIVVLSPYVFDMVVAPNLVDVRSDTVPPAGLLQAQKVFELTVAVALLVYLAVRHRVPMRAFGVRLDGLGVQFACAPLALVGVYAALIPMVLIVGAIVLLFPEMQGDLAGRYELVSRLAERSLAQTVALMIPVAIHEEIVFRGLLIPCLRRLGMGWIGAALVSSAIFASLHGAQGFLGILQIFVLGLAFAAAFILTRSLLVVALAHFGFNTLQVLIAPFLMKLAEQAGGVPGGP